MHNHDSDDHQELVADYQNGYDSDCDTLEAKPERLLRTHRAGDTIILNGDDSHYACKLVSGTAKVIREGDVVATIRPGEYFGAIAALTGTRRSATVVAADRCIVEKIQQQCFKRMIESNPNLLDKIL